MRAEDAAVLAIAMLLVSQLREAPRFRSRNPFGVHHFFRDLRRYWPGANPVGRTIVFGNRQRQIVGIVRNAHTTGLESVEPVYYELTAGGPSTRLLVRSRTADPTPRVQAIASALDNRVAVLARSAPYPAGRHLAALRVPSARGEDVQSNRALS